MTKKAIWIITTIIVPIIIAVIVEKMKIIDFSSLVKSIYEWLIAFFTQDFSISFSLVGWILLFIATLILYFLVKTIYKKIKKNDPYEYYKNDNFFGISWSWDYYIREVLENSLQPLCPNCGFELQPYRASAYDAVNHVGYVCKNCGWRKNMEVTESQVVDIVIKSIEHNIRKKLQDNS